MAQLTHASLSSTFKLCFLFSQVAIKIISTAEAPVEYTKKFLPREIYSLNVTYKHLNVVSPWGACAGPFALWTGSFTSSTC